MGAPMKSRMFRMSDEDFALLQSLADAKSADTGLKVTRSDMLRLMIRGAAKLSTEDPKPIVRAGRKRRSESK
jgi:hypothetical protein